MLQYKIVTDVTTEPITLAEAKAQLRVLNNVDDSLISSDISAARDYAEGYLGCVLAQKTVEVVTDTLSDIDLPLKPAVTLTSVTVTDSEGNEHDVTSDFVLDTYNSKLVYTGSSTITLAKVNPIKITYVANGVPSQKTRQAMMLLITHFYENRGDENQGMVNISPAVDRLLGMERHPIL